jgi:hypothetical protein
MKTSTFNIALFILVLITIQLPMKAEQVKRIHKSWPVNKVTSLAVENKFGNINFLNTRDDSVIIDVVIDTDDDSYRNGKGIADQIDFSFTFENGKIVAQTLFEDKFRTNRDFSINYTINIPVSKELDISNKFGNVTLEDLNAKGKFEVSYGNIFGNSIMSPANNTFEIDLKYSNATFNKINRLTAQIAYSKFRTGNIETAELETRYSTINLTDCIDLNSNSQYDNFTIEKLQSINTDSKFTGWTVNEIGSDAEFNTEYGDVKVGHVSKKFNKIKIENRYGNIRLGIDKDASYELNSETWYCDVIYPKTTPVKYFKENNHTVIEAVIGNGNPFSKVNIESKYGKVDLME